MTLREFLTKNQDKRFRFHGETVDAHFLCNRYSAYLDAVVDMEKGRAFFRRQEGREPWLIAEIVEEDAA